MFVGQYQSKLDVKHRVKIPKRMWRQIEKSCDNTNLFLAPGYERCLSLYTEEEFLERRKKLQDQDNEQAEVRKLLRLFFSNAEPVELDSLGRFVLLPRHRKWIKNAVELIFVGVNDRIEIWGVESWQKFIDANEEDYDALAEKILG